MPKYEYNLIDSKIQKQMLLSKTIPQFIVLNYLHHCLDFFKK